MDFISCRNGTERGLRKRRTVGSSHDGRNIQQCDAGRVRSQCQVNITVVKFLQGAEKKTFEPTNPMFSYNSDLCSRCSHGIQALKRMPVM